MNPENQPNDNQLASNHTNDTINNTKDEGYSVDLSFAHDMYEPHIIQYYDYEPITHILAKTMTYMEQQRQSGLILENFAQIDDQLWQQSPKYLEVYITNLEEGKHLNHLARGKDYATNILSYPIDIPADVLSLLPMIPLGELIICHAVLEREAYEQGKSVTDHLTHLLVHGILHLLGFDHELGQAEQDEMEGFEIAILAILGIDNPY